MYIYNIYIKKFFFTYSSINGHLDCLHVLTIVNNVVMHSMGVQTSPQHGDFISFGYACGKVFIPPIFLKNDFAG